MSMPELKQPFMKPEDNGKKAPNDCELVEVHLKALDDLVTVNSLFTMAVFIGLSFANPNEHSLENRPECDPEPVIAKRLIFYEVVSFGFFLISSLAAKSLKVLINFYKIEKNLDFSINCCNLCHMFLSSLWRHGLLIVSFLGSVCGIIFLTLSMINLIQIRLGKMSCGSAYTELSITVLGVMVGMSLVVLYFPPFLIGGIADMKDRNRCNNSQVSEDSGSNRA